MFVCILTKLCCYKASGSDSCESLCKCSCLQYRTYAFHAENVIIIIIIIVVVVVVVVVVINSLSHQFQNNIIDKW